MVIEMEEQMKQQFEQFQNGLTAVIEAGSKMAGPVLRSNEVLIDSFGQFVKDQSEFGRTSLKIGQKQAESLTKQGDVTALFGQQDAWSDQYKAATQYGEAVRKNAENAYERLISISREAADAFTGAVDEQVSQTFANSQAKAGASAQ